MLVFYCYSHADESFRVQLETHLSLLRRRGIINEWHDRRITPGQPIDEAIDSALERAQIVLLLVSPDFLASDYCYEREMAKALERHRSGQCVVIPVIIRPVDFEDSPFAGLLALPTDAKPVSTWDNRDEAWLNVAKGIRAACTNFPSDVVAEPEATDEESGILAASANESEFGILDFNAEFESAMDIATTCMSAITDHTEELLARLESGAADASALRTSGATNIAFQARQIANGMAIAYAVFSKRVVNQTDELRSAWERVDRFFRKSFAAALPEANEVDVQNLRNILVSSRDTFHDARQSTLEVLPVLARSARLSASLKLGTGRAESSLRALADQYWGMEQSLERMLALLDESSL